MSIPFKMNYHTNFSLKPQNPCTIIHTKTPSNSLLISYSLFQPRLHKTHIQPQAISSSSSSSSSIQKSKENKTSLSSNYYNVEFKTLGGCKLGISRYPDFEYDAEGGFVSGSGKDDSNDNNNILVEFNVAKLYIPPLTSETTKFLGLPLPPFLRIDIAPEIFKGSIHKQSGKVELEFKAELENGKCKLVGVASVDPIDDFFMNSFLSLPTECLAVLNATISTSKF